MKWEKSSEALIETFHAALPDDPRIERRQMFGYPCAFVNGNMFSGLHQSSMVLRLDQPRREDLLARGARTFEPMVGKPMREYVVVPPVILEAPAELRRWTAYALEFGAGLPPKPSARKAAAKKPAAKKIPPKKPAAKKRKR